MSGTAPKRVYRVTGNARRVIAPVMIVIGFLVLWFTVELIVEHANDWLWRAGGVAILLLIWWALDSGLTSRFIQALSDRAVKNDITWAVVSTVLRNFRRLRAAIVPIFDTALFRLLGRLALPAGIALTAAMFYRAGAILALWSRDIAASGTELAALVLDWLLFGFGYGVVGIAAPVVAVLLLVRRRRSTLGIAIGLHILAVFGVSIAYLRIALGAIWGAPDIDAVIEHLVHPAFAEPQETSYVVKLLFYEFLANVVAVFVLLRPRVLQYFDVRPTMPDSASASDPR